MSLAAALDHYDNVAHADSFADFKSYAEAHGSLPLLHEVRVTEFDWVRKSWNLTPAKVVILIALRLTEGLTFLHKDSINFLEVDRKFLTEGAIHDR